MGTGAGTKAEAVYRSEERWQRAEYNDPAKASVPEFQRLVQRQATSSKLQRRLVAWEAWELPFRSTVRGQLDTARLKLNFCGV